MSSNVRTTLSEPVGSIHGADHMPDELLNTVFGNLSNCRDTEALMNCTMVCRQWARAAYPHRFRSMTHEVLRQVGEKEWMEVSLQQRMLKLPNTPNTGYDASSYVQELNLAGGVALSVVVEFQEFEEVLSSFVSLKTLRLDDIQLGTSIPEGPRANVKRRPLDCLQLRGCILKAANLRYFLTLFSVIHLLKMFRCHADDNTEESCSMGPPPVEALVLKARSRGANWDASGLDILARVLDTSLLRSLEVLPSRGSYNEEYNRVVRSLGPGLDTLSLVLSTPQTVAGHVDLSSSPDLSTLRLLFNLPYKNPAQTTSMDEFLVSVWPNVLKAVQSTSPSLRKVVFGLQVEQGHVFNGADRPTFDQYLVRERLIKLDWAALASVCANKGNLEEIDVAIVLHGRSSEVVDSAWVIATEKVIREDCLKRFSRVTALLKFSVSTDGPLHDAAQPITMF